MNYLLQLQKSGLLIVVALLFLSLPQQAQAQFNRQPYLQKLAQESVLVAWRSSTNAAYEVHYGDSPTNLTNMVASPASTKHGVDLTGLEAYTQYYYQIFDEAGNAVTGPEFFYTAKPDTEPNMNMLVFGDCGVANSDQYAVRDAMLNEAQNGAFDFGIVCGDVSQGNGTEYDNLFFDVYKDITKNYCFFTAIGNHDLNGYPSDDGTAQVFLDDFYQFTNNPAGTEEYYSYEYGNVKMICLHTNFENDYKAGSAQYDWLLSELECRTTEWVFVYFHQPPFCNGWDALWYIPFTPFFQYDGEEEVRNDLVPVFEQYNVDFVFNGHMHGYERGELNGVQYVTSGGGGGALDSSVPNDWAHISVQNYTHHYLLVNVVDSTLTVNAIDENGNNVDQFSITKNSSALVAAWEATVSPCDGDAAIDLSTFLHPRATTGGVWSGIGVTANSFDPTGLAAGTYPLTYTVGTAPCTKAETHEITVTTCPVIVQAKVFLEAVYDTINNEMFTELRSEEVLDLAQPFGRSPWFYSGTESVADINDIDVNVVDWVLLEIRTATDSTTVVERTPAFLLKDGTIVDIDGVTNGVNFYTLTPNTPYYIVVRTRNHLATMSSVAEVLPNATPYDFSSALTQAYGTSQQVEVATGVFAQIAGDFDSNGVINYADFNYFVFEGINNSGYSDGDLNMDSVIDADDFDAYFPNASVEGMDEVRF